MWELDCEESWMPKIWRFWTVVLEKTLASPLKCKEIQPVHPRGNESWVLIGRTDVEAEIPIHWPFERVDSFEKTLILGKIEGRRRRGWQRLRWLDGITDSMDVSLACCDSWGCKESDTTEQLNWTELNHVVCSFCWILVLIESSCFHNLGLQHHLL